MVNVPAHPRIRAACALAAGGLLLAAPATVVGKGKPDSPPATVAAKGKPGGGGASPGTTPCSILTPHVAPGVIHTVGHYTVTPSGNVALVCHGRVPQGPTRTIRVNGLRCPTPAGVTTKSHTVITRSGRVTLTCHVKG